MAKTLPGINLIDTEKVLLSAAPTKPDGSADETATVSWTSSNTSQVGIDVPAEIPGTDPPLPNDRHLVAWATTPGENGSAIVTITVTGGQHPSYEDELQPITYSKPAAGSINVSAGTPVPD